MFDDEAIRLIREKWPNPTMLAEEIYSILMAQRPTLTNSPIIITNEGDQTPLIIRNLGDAPLAIQITSKDPTSPTGHKTVGIDNDGNTTPAPTTETPTTGGSAVPGQVVSGSGTSYSVKLFENGTSVAFSQQVPVTVANIADGNLAAGDWIMVTLLSTGAYEGLATVWYS